MKTSVSSPPVFVDTTSLKYLARDLRKMMPAAAKALRVGLKASGQIVADEAKELADWSSRIPGTVKVRTAGVTVKVIAGGPTAPHAPAFEHRGQPGTFRHPVFEVSGANGGGGRYYGKRKNAPKAGVSRHGGIAPWVDQQARPFLGPAAEHKGPELEDAVGKAVSDAMSVAGFDLESA